MFENPISCILIGFVAGFAACYALGIIRFDMSIRVSHQDDAPASSQDVESSVSLPAELDQRKMEFARYLVANDYLSDQR